VWVGESYGADAVTTLTWLAAHTTRIGLGAAVLQVPARSPAATAMTAATLDRLSGGRARIGLGPSSRAVSEGWHGVGFADPLSRMRAYAQAVRRSLAGERAGGLRLGLPPVQERVPLLLAGLGPRAIALAGEVADGWLGMFVVPEHPAPMRAALQEGAARGGRTLDAAFDISPSVPLAIGALPAARDAVRPHVALYVGAMGSRTANPYNRLAAEYGFADAARTIQDHYLDGRREDAVAAVPDALVDLLALVGPPDRVRDRLADFRAGGVTTLQVLPLPLDGPATDQVRQVADLL
jgi:alkanesulfonate monooxygenase SsuD/methylene tetrahydromethanopterin reductase-like flavin-dependent oxidoreductase (luciferase family)